MPFLKPPTPKSERDWSYAKRTLACGDDPEEVIPKLLTFALRINHLQNTTRGTLFLRLRPVCNTE